MTMITKPQNPSCRPSRHPRGRSNEQRGFVALTAVILIATGVISYSLATLSASVFYAESVEKREYRIQTNLNDSACLDTVTLMVVKDYFLKGSVSIPEFDCTATISNDWNGHVSVNVTATMAGVTMNGSRALLIGDDSITIVSEKLW